MVSENTTSGEEAASYYTESNYHQPPQARGHFASSVAFSFRGKYYNAAGAQNNWVGGPYRRIADICASITGVS